MKRFVFIHLLIGTLMLPVWLYGVEILEAEYNLPSRFTGRPQVDEHFGSRFFTGPKDNNYLLGSAWYEESREVVVVLGFRLTESFLQEWKAQGQAQLLFSIIEFHEGDARRICPIHIERLVPDNTVEGVLSKPPVERLGSIMARDLEEDRLYSFPIAYQKDLKPGDIIWIGFDSTNPCDEENHNLIIAGDVSSRPGGPPPILIADTPDAASRTVHGMSLLQSLNRRFYSPESVEKIAIAEKSSPRWVNPLRTANKMETLEIFRQTLEQQLAKIPDCPVSVPEHFKGFHSSIKSENGPWELRFPVRGTQSSIALYPAVRWNGTEAVEYAFPKRFIITAIPYQGRAPVTVTDWSHADFPHSGFTPVIFPFKWDTYKEVRMTIQKGVPVSGGYAFALSEVSFPRRYDIFPIPLETAPEDSLEAPPYWSTLYATDSLTPFGSPAPSTGETNGTFRTFMHESNTVQVDIRQSRRTTFDSFEFHPTQNPDGLPPEDFPQSIRVEFSDMDDFSEIIQDINTSEKISLPNGDYPYIFRFNPIQARCVRITLDPNIPIADGQWVQLEEITFNGGLSLARLRILTQEKRVIDTSTLYDEIINGHPWLPPLSRTVNLLRRDILTDELIHVENTMQALRQAHQRTIAMLKAGGIGTVSVLLGLTIIHQRRQSRKAQLRIRHRIQQDLHDEIGSQLSTISLITDANKDVPELPDAIRTELTDANQCAREAIASLREVIWLTDKEILTLDQCFNVMQKRAEQMVHSKKLVLDFPKNVPAIQLSFKAKRNLILFFTEALNNALKHSNADTIHVSCRLKDRELTLSISDNGRGFDPESVSSGIGLKSMQERARKLGGRVEITSAPGKGTVICLQGELPNAPLYK